MAVPTMGLNEGDPRQLGGYRLLGRVRDSSLGVVYLGRDGSGNQVSVAVLDSGAAGDGGARERFAEAVRRSPDVVAARTDGRSALWVALAHDGTGAAAEDFLKVAARSGRAAARGPVVMPHWAGSRGPVSVRWAPWAGRRDSAVAAGESNWWLIGGLGLVLVLILLLVSLLYWWMLQFPPPEMPSPAQPPEAQESPESPQGPGTLPGEGDGEDGGAEPTPVMPTPGEGGGEWGDDPEDNL
ncbi:MULTISPECIES: hypothetical protein [Nocardiopsis]|uniref:Serine/threonine protein kinase n=2 Tax=Nocardiopsis TaxID=2013 RepID=D7B6B7_NOCDD|nr:hypothetical protein [Nocardiopsis dassonvillei]ADH67382.1 conserved hypothetical protein [Nocardiopsis dassonvillei subsp. dassonvillei DSM 43111]NKY77385.1 hypothetical protein [Nocardiopsis dassonvillei]VEI87524.1 Uncharacterised protein [Nocardiopsis dassonvillei]